MNTILVVVAVLLASLVALGFNTAKDQPFSVLGGISRLFFSSLALTILVVVSLFGPKRADS